MLEIESLGPLTMLAPGATVEHTERWHLFRDVSVPHDDRGVDEHIVPRIRSIL